MVDGPEGGIGFPVARMACMVTALYKAKGPYHDRVTRLCAFW